MPCRLSNEFFCTEELPYFVRKKSRETIKISKYVPPNRYSADNIMVHAFMKYKYKNAVSDISFEI